MKPHQRLAQDIVDKGMGVPAVLFLESFKPLSVLGQQTLFAASPFAKLGGFAGFHRDLVEVFENRESLENLVLEVEKLLEARG